MASLLSSYSVIFTSYLSWIRPLLLIGSHLSLSSKVIAPRIDLSVSTCAFARFPWWALLPWLLYNTCSLLMASLLIISWHTSWSTLKGITIMLLGLCVMHNLVSLQLTSIVAFPPITVVFTFNLQQLSFSFRSLRQRTISLFEYLITIISRIVWESIAPYSAATLILCQVEKFSRFGMKRN